MRQAEFVAKLRDAAEEAEAQGLCLALCTDGINVIHAETDTIMVVGFNTMFTRNNDGVGALFFAINAAAALAENC